MSPSDGTHNESGPDVEQSSSSSEPAVAERLRRIWGVVPERTKPGPRPSLTTGMLVDAGVALADESGVDGLSLVRVARRLGVTTNALYRHISSREELDVLVQDHALGAPDPSVVHTGETEPEPWESTVARWAYALRARYLAHPWLAELTINVPVSPNALAWLDALLAGLGGSGLDHETSLRAAALIDGYVKTRSLTPDELTRRTTLIADPTTFRDVVEPLLVEKGLHHVAALVDAGFYRPAGRAQEATDAEFEFGLRCILSGLRHPPTTTAR